MPRIIVLGSSAVFPLPRTVSNKFEDYLDIEKYQHNFELHKDKLCIAAKRGGKDLRTRASLALVLPQGTILFDAGPDVQYQLRKFKIKPQAVFISHNHIDACFGLQFLQNVKIYSEKLGTIKPGRVVEIFGTQITPFRVIHSYTASCLGYRVVVKCRRKIFSFVYISDIASVRGVKKFAQTADVCFADGSILQRDLGGHLSIVNQLKFYKQWDLKKVYFTHIGHATKPHEELRAFVKGRFKNADVAYDGLVLKF